MLLQPLHPIPSLTAVVPKRSTKSNNIKAIWQCRCCGYHSKDKNQTKCKRCLSPRMNPHQNTADRKEHYTNFYSNTTTASYDRIMDALMTHAVTNENVRFLDIACDGAFTVDVSQHTFTDTSSWQIKTGSSQSDVGCSSLQELIESNAIKPNSIDVIILHHAVYYLDMTQLQYYLNAIISWLTYEGVLLITVMDDENAFVENIYKEISPQYRLSRRIEEILTKSKTVQYYEKNSELRSIWLTFKEHLCKLKSMTIRDCLNHNYFPNGLGEEQLHKVENQCIRFIKKDLSTVDGDHAEDGVVYEHTVKMMNFVVKKESKKSAMKRVYAMIGTALGVFAIVLL